MRLFRAACTALAASLVGVGVAGASEPNVSSLASHAVTVYGARWCSACRVLESALDDRKIAYTRVDVDESPAAFARARTAAGADDAVPLTSVARPSGTVWIRGADIEAVDRAQRGE